MLEIKVTVVILGMPTFYFLSLAWIHSLRKLLFLRYHENSVSMTL